MAREIPTCEVRVGEYTPGASLPMCGAPATHTVLDASPDGMATSACPEHVEKASKAYPKVIVNEIPQVVRS